MKKLLMFIPLVFLLWFTFSCQKGEEVAEESVVDVEADIAAIKGVLDDWNAAYNAGDSDKIVSLYTEDAMIMEEYEPIQVGKEAILTSFKQGMEWNDLQVDEGIVEDVRVSGNLGIARGIDIGTITPKEGGDSIKFNVGWVVICERQADGAWKIVYEISYDNIQVPPPSPEKE